MRKTTQSRKSKQGTPTTRMTYQNNMVEPDSYLEYMDVDRVGMAVRSARGGSTQTLFALYRDIVQTDAHLQGEFAKRKIAVLGDRFRVLPYDKKKTPDVEAARFVESALNDLPTWRSACNHLLDGCLWPVSVVEKLYVPDAGGRFLLSALVPVPHYLLDFSSGDLRIFDTDPEGQLTGTSHEVDPNRYIVHRGHLLTSPDTYGGPMRSLVYWWLAGTMNRDWWIRFLDRYGSPFILGKYKAGNLSDRDLLLSAMASSRKLFGLAVSTSTTVELIEASKSSVDAFERFHDVANREKSKLILGQTLSAQSSPTGEMGGGTASLQTDVRSDLRAFDASCLAETLRGQLIRDMCSFAQLAGVAPYLVWGSLSIGEIRARADVLAALKQAGLEPDDEGVEGLGDDVGFGLQRSKSPVPSATF